MFKTMQKCVFKSVYRVRGYVCEATTVGKLVLGTRTEWSPDWFTLSEF